MPFVLAVGAANMDIAGSARHPLAAGDSTPGTVRHAPGGVARNVAENLARLGTAVRLLSPVGNDAQGLSVLAATRAAGVEVHGCWVLEDAPTSSYLSLHGPDGEMVAAVNDMSILERVTPERLTPHLGTVSAAAALLLDCNLPEAALGWLFARHRDTPVFVDCVSASKCPRLRPWLNEVHTLKLNRLELQALWSRPIGSDAAAECAVRWLHTQGVRQIVLSAGERGVYRSSHTGTAAWQAAVPVVVQSATGAGDALLAGLLHEHLRGVPFAQGVSFALGCAALTLASPHAVHPDLSVAAVQHLLASVYPAAL